MNLSPAFVSRLNKLDGSVRVRRDGGTRNAVGDIVVTPAVHIDIVTPGGKVLSTAREQATGAGDGELVAFGKALTAAEAYVAKLKNPTPTAEAVANKARKTALAKAKGRKRAA